MRMLEICSLQKVVEVERLHGERGEVVGGINRLLLVGAVEHL